MYTVHISDVSLRLAMPSQLNAWCRILFTVITHTYIKSMRNVLLGNCRLLFHLVVVSKYICSRYLSNDCDLSYVLVSLISWQCFNGKQNSCNEENLAVLNEW
jgi:hypothetical protein